MMGYVISHLLIISIELILWSAADTPKGVMSKEQIVLPSFRAFMNDIAILVTSQFGDYEPLQSYQKLFTNIRMAGAYHSSEALPGRFTFALGVT